MEKKVTASAYSTLDGWAPLSPAEPNSLLRIIPVAMTDTDADRCRKEAEECRKQAERSVPLARYGDLVADYRPRRPTGEELDTLVAHMFSAILSETRPSRTSADVSAVFARSKLCQGEPRWRRVLGAFGGAGR